MTLQFHIFYQNDMQIPCVAFIGPIMDGNGLWLGVHVCPVRADLSRVKRYFTYLYPH